MEFKIHEIIKSKEDSILILRGYGKRNYEYSIILEPATDERAQEILREFETDAKAASKKYHAYVEIN